MSSDYLANMTGIKNPITHAGRVVYNAQRDSVETRRRKRKNGDEVLFPAKHDEDYSIQPYELCIRNKRTKFTRYAPNDTDIHVFSSANGMFHPGPVLGPGATPQQIRAAAAKRMEDKRDQLQFAGVASNRAAYDPNNDHNEEHLAVQVGGLQTVYNTGDKEIHAGQIILWDMPTENAGVLKIPGVQKSKYLFKTVPYDQAADTALAAALDQVLADAGVVANARTAVIKKLKAAYEGLQSRVVGKALSSAKKGKPFDILLGHYGV